MPSCEHCGVRASSSLPHDDFCPEQVEETRAEYERLQAAEHELIEQVEQFKKWQTGAMAIIAPLSEKPCFPYTHAMQLKTCLELGVTGHDACLHCKAKHFRENGVAESRNEEVCECGVPGSAHGGCRNFRPVRKCVRCGHTIPCPDHNKGL